MGRLLQTNWEGKEESQGGFLHELIFFKRKCVGLSEHMVQKMFCRKLRSELPCQRALNDEGVK